MKFYEITGSLLVSGLLALPTGLSAQDPAGGGLVALDPYVVGEALPPLDPGREMVSMTLEQAIQRALESNLDVQSARLDPVIQRFALGAARAAYTPTLSMSYGLNNSTTQSTSQLDGGATTTSERQTFNTSLSKPLPYYGGRLNASFNNSRLETNNSFSTRNPSYNSTASLSYTQPLLAGLRSDNQRAALQTQELQGQISDLRLTSQLENIMRRVRSGYWNLRATIEQIEIQRRSLAQADQLVAQNEVRVEVGRATRFQLIQAEAQQAIAEQSLLNAEIQWRNQELAFKQLLLGGPTDPLLLQTINPVDPPTLVSRAVDIEAAIMVALRDRTDLRQSEHQQGISEVNLEVTKSNQLPTLDLTASYSAQGVGGDLFERSGLGGEPVLLRSGGYGDGLSSIANLDAPSWSISLAASYPIGNNSAKRNLQRAELQLEQLRLSRRAEELAVVTQVTAAGLAVSNTFLQLQAARRSREASELNLQAELTRFDVGIATNFELVTAQNTATTARLSELQSLINHLNSISEFDRVQRVGN